MRWPSRKISRSPGGPKRSPPTTVCRRRIEIVRCFLSVLTPADQLFITLERLAGEGCVLLYTSHRLEEVKRLCHDATILRQGRLDIMDGSLASSVVGYAQGQLCH